MLEGMLAAAAGMDAQQEQLDAIGNDLANAQTTGYKAERVGFRDLLYSQLDQAGTTTTTGAGAAAELIGRNQAQGAVQQTGNPLDLAIEGDGYFTVKRADGSTALTRDGKTLLAGTKSGEVLRWELATGKVRREFGGHAALVRGVAFSPDGKLLVSGSNDSTILVWDLSTGGAKAKPIDRNQMESSWQALADGDAAKGFQATRALTASPKETIAWFNDKLKPAVPIDMKRVEEMIAQVGSDQFKVRATAINELLKLGEQ